MIITFSSDHSTFQHPCEGVSTVASWLISEHVSADRWNSTDVA